ncbi:MAG: 50S ribosomal protein L18 [Candidatus Levybacteria bacterium RIFCSPLOWO2_01_FULL_39_10]|nr:MAG: 50S ribosomal protein L18 [Candidatus Levybacteria bacterium RIFCSPLOWO2_01_FULL_39_10]
MKNKKDKKLKRKLRIRTKVRKFKKVPRVSVFRSNKFISAQLIDDSKNLTLASVTEKDLKGVSGTKTEKAKSLGLLMAKNIKSKKVEEIVFDRGPYAYHGRVKSFAEGLREGGISF